MLLAESVDEDKHNSRIENYVHLKIPELVDFAEPRFILIHFSVLKRGISIESHLPNNKKTVCGVTYRQHNNGDEFLEYLSDFLERQCPSISKYLSHRRLQHRPVKI